MQMQNRQRLPARVHYAQAATTRRMRGLHPRLRHCCTHRELCWTEPESRTQNTLACNAQERSPKHGTGNMVRALWRRKGGWRPQKSSPCFHALGHQLPLCGCTSRRRRMRTEETPKGIIEALAAVRQTGKWRRASSQRDLHVYRERLGCWIENGVAEGAADATNYTLTQGGGHQVSHGHPTGSNGQQIAAADT